MKKVEALKRNMNTLPKQILLSLQLTLIMCLTPQCTNNTNSINTQIKTPCFSINFEANKIENKLTKTTDDHCEGAIQVHDLLLKYVSGKELMTIYQYQEEIAKGQLSDLTRKDMQEYMEAYEREIKQMEDFEILIISPKSAGKVGEV